MQRFTLEYWQDDGWYVGRIKEIPGVFSQGETLSALEENIREAYQLMMEEHCDHAIKNIQTKEMELEV